MKGDAPVLVKPGHNLSCTYAEQVNARIAQQPHLILQLRLV